MNPAMSLSWIFGLALILSQNQDVYSFLWVKLKLFFVILLTIYHFALARYLKKFANNENEKSAKFFRIINEIPTVLLVLIIVVVIYKPL